MLRQFLEWSAAEPPLTGETLLDAWIGRDILRAEFLAQMRTYPILLCPAAAIPAFRHGERSWTIEGKTRELSRCLELHGMVQSFGESRGGGSCEPSPANLKGCRSEYRSSGGRGKKNKCWPWLRRWRRSAERGEFRRSALTSRERS